VSWRRDLDHVLRQQGGGALARRLGVNRSTIARWRRGATPSAAAQAALSEMLGRDDKPKPAAPSKATGDIDLRELERLGELGFDTVPEALDAMSVDRERWPSERAPLRRALDRGRAKGKLRLLELLRQATLDRNAALCSTLVTSLRAGHGWAPMPPAPDPLPASSYEGAKERLRAVVEKLAARNNRAAALPVNGTAPSVEDNA
jgi:transcriptional regulator with XRE-family HTH domain